MGADQSANHPFQTPSDNNKKKVQHQIFTWLSNSTVIKFVIVECQNNPGVA